MRLIDADALTFESLTDSICQGQAEEVVAEAPTIEAEPVRYGQWNTIQGDIVVCSICGRSAPQIITGCLVNRHLEPNRTNYCPNCGAKMEGER